MDASSHNSLGEGESLPPRPKPHRRHSAGHALLFAAKRVRKRNWWILAGIVVGLAAVAITLVAATGFQLISIVDAIDGLRPVPLIIAMAVLPLIGFPIMPVYVVTGVRFGPAAGGAVVALVTAVHLLGTYLIARSILRRPLQRLLARWHAELPHIPRDEEAAVAVIAVLVPGLPYVVRNYLLAMTGIRLRVYFWISLPIYVARSYVSILLGDFGAEPSRDQLIILGVVETLKVAICGGVIWWLRQHHRRYHGHDHHAPA